MEESKAAWIGGIVVIGSVFGEVLTGKSAPGELAEEVLGGTGSVSRIGLWTGVGFSPSSRPAVSAGVFRHVLDLPNARKTPGNRFTHRTRGNSPPDIWQARTTLSRASGHVNSAVFRRKKSRSSRMRANGKMERVGAAVRRSGKE
jgi:hypothetical protein